MQGQHWLHREFEASLGYMKAYLKSKTKIVTLIALEILKQILQELATAAHTSLAVFPGEV